MRTKKVYNPHTGRFWYIEVSKSGHNIAITKDEARELIIKLEKELEDE